VTRSTPPAPPGGSPARKAGGCLLHGIILWFEFTIGVVIAAMIAEKLGPALAARGYNTNIGNGFLIAWGLGAAVAIYPVIWIDRLRRRRIR
jgi:hypothetical protein